MNATMTISRKTATTVTRSLLAGAAMMIFSTAASAADFSTYSGTNTEPVDHAAWGDFLSTYLKPAEIGPNLVDYGAVSDADHHALKAYIDSLEAIDPTPYRTASSGGGEQVHGVS